MVKLISLLIWKLTIMASSFSSTDVDVVDAALSDLRAHVVSGSLSAAAAVSCVRTLLTALRNIRDDFARIKYRYINRSKIAGKIGALMPILLGAAGFTDADGCGQLVQYDTDAARLTSVYAAVVARVADDQMFAEIDANNGQTPALTATAADDIANTTFLLQRVRDYTVERAYLLALRDARDEKRPLREDEEIADLFNETWTDTSPYQLAAITELYKLIVTANAQSSDAVHLFPVGAVLPRLNQCERVVRLSKLIGFVWSESFVSFPANADVSRLHTALALFAPYIAAVESKRSDGRQTRLDALEAKLKPKQNRNKQNPPPPAPPPLPSPPTTSEAVRLRDTFDEIESSVFRLRRIFGVAYRIEWTISLFSGKEYDDTTLTSEPHVVTDGFGMKWRGVIIKRRAKGAAPPSIGIYIECVGSAAALKSLAVTVNMTPSVLHRTARVPCGRPYAPVMFLTQTVSATATKWGFTNFITQDECSKLGAFNKAEDAITFRMDFGLTHQTNTPPPTPKQTTNANTNVIPLPLEAD